MVGKNAGVCSQHSFEKATQMSGDVSLRLQTGPAVTIIYTVTMVLPLFMMSPVVLLDVLSNNLRCPFPSRISETTAAYL